MEDLLHKLTEQNERLIALGEQTVVAIRDLDSTLTSEFASLDAQLTLNESSSAVGGIESKVDQIADTLDKVLAALNSQ